MGSQVFWLHTEEIITHDIAKPKQIVIVILKISIVGVEPLAMLLKWVRLK